MATIIPNTANRIRWTNWTRQYSERPSFLAAPKSLRELLQTVQFAADRGLSVRMTGAGHSSTKVAVPDGMWIKPHHLSGKLPNSWLKKPSGLGLKRGEHLIRVKAGTRVKSLNRLLLQNHRPKLSISNMGSFDGQTVAGALSTGTHGSSLYFGPMADSVVSVDLVSVEDMAGNPQARHIRIEPTGGITFPNHFRKENPKAVLIQNDDAFSAAVLNFGTVGVFFALTLKVESQFWLAEENEVMSWGEIKRKIRSERSMLVSGTRVPRFLARGFAERASDRDTSPRYVEFYVNVAKAQKRGDYDSVDCLVRTRYRVPRRMKPRQVKSKYWPPRRLAEMGGALDLYDAFVKKHSVKKSGLAGASLATTKIFKTTARADLFERGSDASVSHYVLRRLRDTTDINDAPIAPHPALSNEIAVPISKTIAAVERILDVMHRERWAYQVPFGVRFVGGSRQALAVQRGPVCMIETPVLLPELRWKDKKRTPLIRQAERMLSPIEEALCYARNSIRGLPHWGQYNEIDAERLEKLYGRRLRAWRALRSRFNVFGTFDNAFTRQLGE